MSGDTDQGRCDLRRGEQPNPMESICSRPATLRYRAMSGGYMRLCEEHGAKHIKYCEQWNGRQWVTIKAPA